MDDLIRREDVLAVFSDEIDRDGEVLFEAAEYSEYKAIEALPSVEPERKNDIIQKFCDYQVDWLTSHTDIEFAPTEESLIVRFLRDTAECYIMEVEHD